MAARMRPAREKLLSAEREDVQDLIVVGSSAGGIDALSRLVAKLPEDLAVPLVLAQHLDPHHDSRLTDILARRTSLPVRTAKAGEKLRPGVVYVIPSNVHGELDNQRLRLITPEDGGPKPSIDRLFSTAAEAFKESAIAVILTGTGSDGAAGAMHIKRNGGTVIIQDPETARFPGLPLSLSPSIIDASESVENIPDLIAGLLRTRAASSFSLRTRRLIRLLSELRERQGY